ncbi:MAG: hypothetical protein U0T32_06900 [Chitinophagales bacterium]|jgi:hypothetical protein
MKNTISLFSMLLLLLSFSSCSKESESMGSGSMVFYTNSNVHGSIYLSVSSTSFKLPITSNPESYCTSGYTGWVLLDVGSYDYHATATDGKSWSGSIEIKKGVCQQKLLY